MRFAAILPHALLFGGVKHYLEVGETIISRGHSFDIFTPEGKPADWCTYAGRFFPLSELASTQHDAIITSEEAFLNNLTQSRARLKFFYVINQNRSLPQIAKNKEIIFLANSSRSVRHIKRKIGVTAYQAFCGVNTDDYKPRTVLPPLRPFTVITYGRQVMKLKGTHLVKKACENLYKKGYDIKLLLFDTITGERIERDYKNFSATCPWEFVINHPIRKNFDLYYRANAFASAERKGTWANTASEAMACGVPVIASLIGSDDFLIPEKTGIRVGLSAASIEKAIKRLYESPDLCTRLSQAGSRFVKQWQWRISADRILALALRSDAQAVSRHTWPFTPRMLGKTRTPRFKKISPANKLDAGVFIFNYHAIINQAAASELEKGFTVATTTVQDLESHIAWLSSVATPICLTTIPELLSLGNPDKPYFAITFDDGFRNILTNAAPVLKKYGINATAFVNTAFAQGNASAEVKISELLRTGHFESLAKSLQQKFGFKIHKPKHIYAQIKGSEFFSEAVSYINELSSNLITEKIHLSFADMKELIAQGWHIGNHTAHHSCLSRLSHEDQATEIEDAIASCKEHNIPLISWLAYPYGGPSHVNGSTLFWMHDHPDWYGLFANGGVNHQLERTEMLRMGVGSMNLGQFKQMIAEQIFLTNKCSSAN